MKVAKQPKRRSRKESSKKGKTFRAKASPQLLELIDFANILRASGLSLWSLDDMAALVSDELGRDRNVEIDDYAFGDVVLSRCLDGLLGKVKDFVVNPPRSNNPAFILQEAALRYENLRVSLRKLTALAHANKIIWQHNEKLDDVAAFARAYFDGQNNITKSFGLNALNLRLYKEKLFRVRGDVERYEMRAATRKLDLNQMQNLLQSLHPLFISTHIDEAGTVHFIKDFLSEEIEGVEGAVFLIRECDKCSHVFWAKNIKTITCLEHRNARRDDRRDFGTKKSRLSGKI
jgi:hypothetical protein